MFPAQPKESQPKNNQKLEFGACCCRKCNWILGFDGNLQFLLCFASGQEMTMGRCRKIRTNIYTSFKKEFQVLRLPRNSLFQHTEKEWLQFSPQKKKTVGKDYTFHVPFDFF